MTTIAQQCTYGADPVTQSNKYAKMSEAYQFASSEGIKQELCQEFGLTHIGTSIARVRKGERQGYQKHVMVFGRQDLAIGQDPLRLYVYNSHDGTSSLSINLGILRMICANGLVSGNNLHKFNVVHKGANFALEVKEAMAKAIEAAPNLCQRVLSMQERTLTDAEADSIREYAASLRLPDHTVDWQRSAFRARRQGDVGQGLWETYNRAQEVTIRGGLRYLTRKPDAPVWDVTNGTTRAIKSVSETMRLNRALWTHAESYLNA